MRRMRREDAGGKSCKCCSVVSEQGVRPKAGRKALATFRRVDSPAKEDAEVEGRGLAAGRHV